ncbi:NAD-dependent epimerase/dehydratase family protein [Aliidiomarina sedimenti]|uniref:NAD-dependent epimerase/dehydratase family protein n=1 Tax=Aliidiomarina sedimenti TaxID=1933879 RepID=UPI0013005BA8|nr:NAD-dependent epimerase/dehydratase family protein [Aliidiomarina sedimenti]
MNVLITGATGFIGSALKRELESHKGIYVIGTSQSKANDSIVKIGLEDKNWNSVLQNVDVVIHCAALAHVPLENDIYFREKVKSINVLAPCDIANQAKKNGVKRFIFLSSVKALADSTTNNFKLSVASEYHPEDLYGESKRDAEIALKNELSNSDMDLVIVRPPLVYGRGVKGNFRSLMKLADRNIPLPFKSVSNRRSLVSVDNLVDLIVTCVKYPSSLNETFLVSDDHDVSTKELLETLTQAYGKKPRLLPFPVSVMRVIAGLLGKKPVADRLFGNLQLDISYTKQTLNWQPPVPFEQAIRDCVKTDPDTLNQNNVTS